MASPASTSSSSVMRGAALAQRCAVAREQRDVHERGEARTVVLVRPPRSRASSDSCRDSCRHCAKPAHRCRCRQPRATVWRCAGRTSWRRRRRDIDPLRSRAWSASGQQRGDGVAGAGLDPDVAACGWRGRTSTAPAARCFVEQFRQFAIDGLVGHREDMPGQFDIAQSGAAQPQQPRHQRLASD